MKKQLWLLAALLPIALFGQTSQDHLSSNTSFTKGMAYYSGSSVLKDVELAKHYLLDAASLGNSTAMFFLGQLFSTEKAYIDLDKTLYWYSKAVEKGNIASLANLGNLYHHGLMGVKQDFETAFGYFQKGAEKENMHCISMVGYYYFKKLNGVQDYKKSFEYFSKSSKMGHSMATFFIGLQYRNGYGVERDLEKAKQFIIKAAEQNERQAINELKMPEPENPITAITAPRLHPFAQVHDGYKRIKHNVRAESIRGNYSGFAIRYDFSGKHILSIFPLTVTFNNNNGKITGNWKEQNDYTTVEAFFTDSSLVFNNTVYKKIDHNSELKGGEEWEFREANFNLLQEADSTYISGNIRLYSNYRREPGMPLFIKLSRPTSEVEKLLLDKEQVTLISNNPVSNEVTVTFKLVRTTSVTIQLQSLTGSTILSEQAGVLPAGTYRRKLIIPASTSNGSYTLQLHTESGVKSKLIIKQ